LFGITKSAIVQLDNTSDAHKRTNWQPSF